MLKLSAIFMAIGNRLWSDEKKQEAVRDELKSEE